MKTVKRLIKHWGQSVQVQKILARLGELYMRFVIVTSRWTIHGAEHPQSFWMHHKPVLICAWHERLLMAGHPCVQRPLVILASAHRDGQVISAFLRRFGLDIVPGSTGRGGDRALRVLIRRLKQGTPVAIATDGPRGPRYHVQPGVVGLSRLTQVPIVPFTWSAQRVMRLKTWDRLMIPLPFNRGTVMWGEPIAIDKHMPDSLSMADVQEALTELTARADACYAVRL